MNRNKSLITEIGKELRRLRERNGRSLSSVAEELGVSSMYISEIERSLKNPSAELIEKLPPIYGVSDLDLYEGFKRIPLKVEEEILNNSTLFEILYVLANSDDYKSKAKFYLELEDLYDKIF